MTTSPENIGKIITPKELEDRLITTDMQDVEHCLDVINRDLENKWSPGEKVHFYIALKRQLHFAARKLVISKLTTAGWHIHDTKMDFSQKDGYSWQLYVSDARDVKNVCGEKD